MIVSTKGFSESEWQALRESYVLRGMVGGSDAGTLLGLNKYKAPINMFYQALGISILPTKINSAILHGKQLEDYVGSCWRFYDGTEQGWIDNTLSQNAIKDYRKVEGVIESDNYPYLFANVDGIITKHPDRDDEGILEIKTMSGYAADTYEGGIPPNYLIQLQHYMLVTGLKWGEIVYLKDGRELGCVTFEADPELQERILREAKSFYDMVDLAKSAISLYESEYGPADENQRMAIACNYEPIADHSDAFNDFISEKHKLRLEELSMEAPEHIGALAVDYADLNDQIKALEKDKQYIQNQIKQFMEQHGATVLTLDPGKITWRKQFSVKI